MKEYLVKWEIKVTADSPEEAVKVAQTYQSDDRTEEGYFEIYEMDGTTWV